VFQWRLAALGELHMRIDALDPFIKLVVDGDGRAHVESE
jgi:hypothetical protein